MKKITARQKQVLKVLAYGREHPEELDGAVKIIKEMNFAIEKTS